MLRQNILLYVTLTLMLLVACGNVKPTQNSMEDSMEKLYRIAFEKHVQEQLNLEKYDAFIAESDLNFIPVKEENLTNEKKRSASNLQFIYIRNDIFVDRLSSSDYELLAAYSKQLGDNISIKTEIPTEVTNLVLRTFPSIISPKPINNEEESHVLTAYENGVNPQLFPMNAIVIHIVIQEEFDENGEYVNEENENQKKEFMTLLCDQMNEDFDGIFPDSPVYVFQKIYH